MKTMRVKNLSTIEQVEPGKATTQQEAAQINSEKKAKKSIAICVPCYNTVTAQWMIEFWRFMLYNFNKFIVHIFINEQQPVSSTRNSLAKQALEKNPDYIFWLDSDNMAPNGMIEGLINTLEETGADLVTALYFGKDAPHYPVIRSWRSNGFYKIENPALGQKIQIAGCGFGCLLMKPHVFLQLEKPWFKFSDERWGKDDIVLSEDLFFCRKMLKKGFKLVCDTGLVSAHIGSRVDAMEYMNYAPIRESTMLEREELLKDLQDFTGKSQLDVDMDVMVGPKMMRDEWNDKLPGTESEMVKFYKETESYLYDLTNWHFGNRRRFDMELISACLRVKDQKKEGEKVNVLDFGCGIAQNGIMLARSGFDVTIADLDSYTLKFAEHRFKAHDVPYKVWKTDLEDMPPDEKYDIILAFDVFEHLTGPQLEKISQKLISLKQKGTNLFTTQSFGKSQFHPMHMDMEQQHVEAINKLLGKKEG